MPVNIDRYQPLMREYDLDIYYKLLILTKDIKMLTDIYRCIWTCNKQIFMDDLKLLGRREYWPGYIHRCLTFFAETVYDIEIHREQQIKLTNVLKGKSKRSAATTRWLRQYPMAMIKYCLNNYNNTYAAMNVIYVEGLDTHPPRLAQHCFSCGLDSAWNCGCPKYNASACAMVYSNYIGSDYEPFKVHPYSIHAFKRKNLIHTSFVSGLKGFVTELLANDPIFYQNAFIEF